MNTYNFNDESFKTTASYKNFITTNPGIGYLKIRAYGASGAIPISNLKIIVSKIIDNNTIIFYEGITNSSGIIENIPLPTPKSSQNDEENPQYTTYEIKAIYQEKAMTNNYSVNMYENIYVIQTINVVPSMNVISGGN